MQVTNLGHKLRVERRGGYLNGTFMVEMLTTSVGLADVEKGGKLIVINKI